MLGATLGAGCGDNSSTPGVESLPCDTPTTAVYRIDRVDVPTDSTEASAFGSDLDGDGTVDNQVGNIMSAVLQIYGDRPLLAQWQAQMAARLAGPLDWSIRIDSCPGGEAHAWLVDGDAADATDAMLPAVGHFDATGLAADGGEAILPLGALADFTGRADAGWHPAAAATFALAVDDTDGDDALDGRLALAIAPDYRPVIARAFALFIQDLYDDGETTWGQDVDADGDGQITVDELLADRDFGWLTTADLDADGDGAGESLSMGVVIHATRVAP
ncbi:MAG: hypothetical protein H6709_10300 [Kofleriaceae bacterium]|nr:hypothetical protein [Myxococcales bacterium]MCB9564020.1 hypothetical protein [Kofleriaceae bacterium]MCB9572466.1 hypothetical protein [Kofleriaceae bacterium]